MQNPFTFGKEVSGYQFYDRHQDCKSLVRALSNGSANVVLFAPRRYGKTSLVQKALEQLSLQSGMRCLCFDLTRVPTLAQFCQEYANAVFALFGGKAEVVHKLAGYLAHANPRISFSVAGVVQIELDLSSSVSATSLAEILDLPERLASDAGDVPVAIAFDEFQEIANLSHTIPLEKIFRSCIQAQKNVRYVFLGSKTHLMKRMFGDATRPFYNSALPMPLDRPPAEESIEFLTSRFRDSGITLGLAEADRILSISENIPYYLQALAYSIFECVSSDGRIAVADSDIDAAADAFTARHSELYEERIASLSDSKRRLLTALAEEPTASFGEDYRSRHCLPVSSTIHTALAELVESGLIEKTSACYCLSDPFFVRHIRQSPSRIWRGT